MGAQAMRACVIEALEALRRHTVEAGTTLSDWYDGGCMMSELRWPALARQIGPDWDAPTEQRGATFSYWWGYITGVADAHDQTVRELVEGMGLKWNE